MTMQRRHFPTFDTAVAFSIEIPNGFVEGELPDLTLDYDDPNQSRPLALFADPETGAMLAVAWRPTYVKGCVTDWLDMLAEHFKLTVTGAISGFVGGPDHNHPAMFVEATKGGDILRIAAFEDERSFFTVHTRCPQGHWDDLASDLERAAASIQLANPIGPTVPCVRNGPVVPHDMPDMPIGEWPRGRGELRERKPDMDRWRAATRLAPELVRAGKYDEADRLVVAADPGQEHTAFLANLYLEELRANAKKPHATALYDRAMRWHTNWPDPHTEIEAEHASQAYAEIRAKLNKILGRDPTQ